MKRTILITNLFFLTMGALYLFALGQADALNPEQETSMIFANETPNPEQETRTLLTADTPANEIVVCIDPGHGGDNAGARYNGYEEKDMDLRIAMAMYEELTKYQGVTVVMTRTDDSFLSLKERAEIAQACSADLFVCLHLNASLYHNQFGAEVWVSGFGEYYATGASFGKIVLQELSQQGIFTGRGVKTRIGADGTDYYGVIMHCTAREIPAVIVEHCYMDELRDESFWRNEEALDALGKADATAVAKYFGLRSEELAVDYGDYVIEAVPSPSGVVYQDFTPPDFCKVTLLAYDANTRMASVHIEAQDYQSGICYYNYSSDGGRTWSKTRLWGNEPERDIIVFAPSALSRDILVRVWNNYCEYRQSNRIFL